MQQVKDSTGKSTGTKLEHLQAVEKMTKRKPAELDFPEVESTVAYLLEHFYTIKKTRGEKITYNELQCFMNVMSLQLASWECEVIMTIDSIFEGCVHG